MKKHFSGQRTSLLRRRRQADAFRDHDPSRTRVCVTVGMMTTGYDCEEVLNVVLARPIFSPTDFIQIKGRGTRRFTFQPGEGAGRQAVEKDGFALFDFFANCEFLEKEFEYDQKLELPKAPAKGTDGGEGGGVNVDDFASTSPDPMAQVVREEVGVFGMRIDRERYRERFAEQAGEAVAADVALRTAFEAEDWPAVEERVRRLSFEKTEEFWHLPSRSPPHHLPLATSGGRVHGEGGPEAPATPQGKPVFVAQFFWSSTPPHSPTR